MRYYVVYYIVKNQIKKKKEKKSRIFVHPKKPREKTEKHKNQNAEQII